MGRMRQRALALIRTRCAARTRAWRPRLRLSRGAAIAAVVAAASLVAIPTLPAQTIGDYTRTASGLTVYLGVIPAQVIKEAMHRGAPSGPHDFHITVAIFDAASTARVADATVTAEVWGIGLSATRKRLQPMNIANTITFGGFFYLPGADLYTVRVSVRRPGTQQPVVLDFKYDHRRG